MSQAEMAKCLDESFASSGVVLLRMKPEVAASIARARAAVKRFFELPDEEKEKVYSQSGLLPGQAGLLPGQLCYPGTRRGYVGHGNLSEPNKYGTMPDRRESFTACMPFGDEDKQLDGSEFYFAEESRLGGLFCPNIWPDGVEGAELQQIWHEHYDVLQGIVENIYELIAEVLGYPYEELSFHRHCQEYQGNFYLKTVSDDNAKEVPVVTKGQRWMRPHRDGTDFSILANDPAIPRSHLSCAPRNGDLPDTPNVPYREDCLTILLGTAGQKRSNDRWFAPLHCVELPSNEDANTARVTLVHFIYADYDSVISAPPSVCQKERKWADMTVQDHYFSPIYQSMHDKPAWPESLLEPLPAWKHLVESPRLVKNHSSSTLDPRIATCAGSKSVYMRKLQPIKAIECWQDVKDCTDEHVVEEFSFDVPLAGLNMGKCVGYRMPVIECGRIACEDGPSGKLQWYVHALGWAPDSTLSFVIDRAEGAKDETIVDLPCMKQRIVRGPAGIAAGNRYIVGPEFSQEEIVRFVSGFDDPELLPDPGQRWWQWDKVAGVRLLRNLWGNGTPDCIAEFLRKRASASQEPCAISKWLVDQMPHCLHCRAMFAAGTLRHDELYTAAANAGNANKDGLKRPFAIDYHTDSGLDINCKCRDVYAYAWPEGLEVQHANPFELSCGPKSIVNYTSEGKQAKALTLSDREALRSATVEQPGETTALPNTWLIVTVAAAAIIAACWIRHRQ